jgi:flagellar biosynthesis protein FlhB
VARLAFERRLRMTPDEFKEEMRSMEADTKIKFDRRRK